MNEGERPVQRIPPTIAIFLDSTWFTLRPKVLAELPSPARQRVRWLRFESNGHFQSAFVEELRHAVDDLTSLLGGREAGITILLVTEPGKPLPNAKLSGLIALGIPPGASVSLLWLAHGSRADLTCSTPQLGGASVALLCSVWRGNRLESSVLEEHYSALIRCFLATAVSRFAEPNFNTFSSVRSGPPGRVFLCAAETVAVGDSQAEAASRLESAVDFHYLPRISELASRKAKEYAPLNPEALLRKIASKPLLEVEIAEPLLCAAIADCKYLEEACERLDVWQRTASEPVRHLLTEWLLTFARWQNEAENRSHQKSTGAAAAELFQSCPFPPLARFVGKRASAGTRAAWDRQIGKLALELDADNRAQLDHAHYEFIPSAFGATERLALISTALNAGGEGQRAFVTRHFPEALIRDQRDEVLQLSGHSTTLYWLQVA